MSFLKNRVAVITGASYGIGKAIAIHLAKHGCTTILVARTESDLIKTQNMIRRQGGKAFYIVADIGVEKNIERLTKFIKNKFSKINILINNASGWVAGPLRKTKVDSLNELIKTTVYGTSLITKSLMPFMVNNKNANIIFISSTAGTFHNYSLNTAYVTAKSAIAGLARCLRNEVRRYNIKVSIIHLGQVDEINTITGRKKSIKKNKSRKLSVYDVVDTVLFILRRKHNTSIDELIITPITRKY